MIFQNGEENNNNNIDVCRVTEGLKEKKRMLVDVQGRKKQNKKEKN